MEVIINQIEKSDFNSARKFAIDGMQLAWYTNNNLELYLYSKYFWYLDIQSDKRVRCIYR